MNVYACKAGETENKTEKERKILLTSDFFLFSKINFVQCIVLMKRLLIKMSFVICTKTRFLVSFACPHLRSAAQQYTNRT